jgi:hypothetical protein
MAAPRGTTAAKRHTNLLAGRQYYTFKPVPNYILPSSIYTTVIEGTNVNVNARQLHGLAGVDHRDADSRRCRRSRCGMWSLDGGTNWNENGATVQDLSVKTYTIVFAAATGYAAPASTNYALSAGEAAALSGTYTDVPGALTVTLTPPSAQWSVNGGGTWQNSGTTLSLAAGSYTVTFGAVAGYTTPSSQGVSIVSGVTNALSRTYVLAPVGADCIVRRDSTGRT